MIDDNFHFSELAKNLIVIDSKGLDQVTPYYTTKKELLYNKLLPTKDGERTLGNNEPWRT